MENYQNKSCINCQTQLYGKICHQCGQKNDKKPWTVSNLANQFIQQITNIENGFWYTVKCMFVAPKKIVEDYWALKTIPYFNPFKYVLILTALNVALSFLLGIDDLIQDTFPQSEEIEQLEGAELEAADRTFDSWLNALVLFMLPIFSWFTKYAFHKKGKNYAEHLIMNAFMMGQQSLITSFTNFTFYLFPSIISFFMVFNFVLGWGYNAYVFKQVFKEEWWVTILKALVIGALGLVVFFGFVFLASWAVVELT